MGKRALVTGASGFIGAVLARRLLEEGHEVHLVVPPGSDRWRIDDLEAPVHTVDLRDAERLADILARVPPDWIFHLAAYGAYSSQTDGRLMVETNVLGTFNLVEAALRTGFEALVNTGSSSEYGFADHPPRETDCPRPNSLYAVTKASATLLCCQAAESHDARILTLRLYSVYGPYEEPSRFVPALAVSGLRGELPPLVSRRIARDFVYTEDVVEAYLLAARRTEAERGGVYNVGTGQQVNIEEAVAIAREVLGIEVEPRWDTMPKRSWDTETWVANPEKIRTELGWTPRVAFEEGFRRLVAWLRDHPRLLELYRERTAVGRRP